MSDKKLVKREEKQAAYVGTAEDKLKILKNRDVTPAEYRRMLELAHSEDFKKIKSFINNDKKKDLVLKSAEGKPIVFKKVDIPAHYNGCDNFVCVLIEEPASQNHEGSKHLVYIDRESGINIPFVSMHVGRDSPALFTLGVSQAEMDRRAIANSEFIEMHMLDIQNFKKAELEKIGRKETNTPAEEKGKYWDTWIAPQGHETSSRKAIMSARYGLQLANAIQIILNGLFTFLNNTIPFLCEIDFQHGMAFGSLRSMEHEPITPDSSVTFALNKKPVNLPLVPAIVALRIYSIKNGLDYVGHPILYVPGTAFLMELHGSAFDYELMFDKINTAVPLARMTVQHKMEYRDVTYLICTGTVQETGRTVAFMILHSHGIQAAFETVFNMVGDGLLNHVMDTGRKNYMDVMTAVVQNSGALNVHPFVLDGTNPAAFLSILSNATPNEFFEEAPAGESLDEKQKRIVDSWEELKPFKEVIQQTLPIGIYVDPEQGGLVDCRKEGGGRFLTRRGGAAMFDFNDVVISNAAITDREETEVE